MDEALKGIEDGDGHAIMQRLKCFIRKKDKTAEDLIEQMSNMTLLGVEPEIFFQEIERLNRKLGSIDSQYESSEKKLMLDVMAALPAEYKPWKEIKLYAPGQQLSYAEMKQQLQTFWKRI